jgi:hypothetical protein
VSVGYLLTVDSDNWQASRSRSISRKKRAKVSAKKAAEKLEPRRYHQPHGKPLEIFFPRVTVAIWELVAAKAGLSMPKFPVIGLDGEALGFWNWVLESGCPIIITEGEKKAAALISRGYAAIGLPGIHTGYRVTDRGDWITKPDGTQYQKATARELHATLQPLDTAGREITIIFDHLRRGLFPKPRISRRYHYSQTV